MFFRAVRSVSPTQVLSHRIIWALLFSGLLVIVTGRTRRVVQMLRNSRALGMLTTSSLLLAVNWLVFIYAVGKNKVIEVSFGYYLTPLVNVLLGMLVLRERLARLQAIALGAASVGVVLLSFQLGNLPLVSLSLSITFGLYGLIRKTVQADALSGLLFECAVLTPIALAALWWTNGWMPLTAGQPDTGLLSLLILAGPITAIPLIAFAAGARRLPLVTMGMLQYIAPTLQFLVATLAFREPVGALHLAALGFIAIAITLATAHAFRVSRTPPVLIPE